MIWCAMVTLLAPLDGPHLSDADVSVPTRHASAHRLYTMHEGQELQILTEKHTIRLRAINPRQDEYVGCCFRNGEKQPEFQPLFVFGSTKGRNLDGILVIRAGTIEIGKKLELGVGSRQRKDRVLTDAITSVQVLN